jgi:hypothetical protein
LTASATVETTKEEETKWPQNAQEAQEAEFSRRGAKARRRGFDVEIRKSGNQERETDEEVFTTKERQRGIQVGAK